MGSGTSPHVLNVLVRIAEEIGELYGGSSKKREVMYHKVDALVANGCQCAIFMAQGFPYGLVYTGEKIFYSAGVCQGVLFEDALELLGFTLDDVPF